MTLEKRPWGHFETLRETDKCKVKMIYVKPGGRLSYQRHKHRQEHWFIVSGVATVTQSDSIFEYVAGESIDIGYYELHRVANDQAEPLIFTEIQTGSYFGEDDIERIEDDYNR